jgi:hypothetical protein
MTFGLNLMCPTESSKFFYTLSAAVSNRQINLIVVLHSTKVIKKWSTEVAGFKVEGSESGMKKAVASMLRYNPNNIRYPEKGGTFTVEKSRMDNIRLDDTFIVEGKRTVSDAVRWLKGKEQFNKAIDKDGWIKKSAAGRLAKNNRDKWVKQFFGTIFDEYSIPGDTSIYYQPVERYFKLVKAVEEVEEQEAPLTITFNETLTKGDTNE